MKEEDLVAIVRLKNMCCINYLSTVLKDNKEGKIVATSMYIDVVDHDELKAVLPQVPDMINSYVVCCKQWHFDKLMSFFKFYEAELVKKMGG